ncbi:MAG: hypothetical protein JEY94_16875 [Melioribacteraceae bacterium]|nr:hypothetical protein [Melioribacteraceae bacterium]
MKYIVFIFLAVATINIHGQNTPHLNDGIIFITEFIGGDDFLSLKDTTNDIDLADSIFVTALKYYSGNISEALLALTFATLPYKKLPINILGIDIPIPLPHVGGEIYKRKNANLPKYFFFNSPATKFGDKDKLAHFFGNAFIAYNFESSDISSFLGAFVELFESLFYSGGNVDNRDIMVNSLGKNFGILLKHNEHVLPSGSLKLYNLYFMKFNFSFIH